MLEKKGKKGGEFYLFFFENYFVVSFDRMKKKKVKLPWRGAIRGDADRSKSVSFSQKSSIVVFCCAAKFEVRYTLTRVCLCCCALLSRKNNDISAE